MASKELCEKIIQGLLCKVPEFKNEIDDRVTDYLILDDLGTFVKQLLRKDDSSGVTDRCYDYINTICNVGDRELEEWLMVTFFESMVEIGKPIQVSRIKLKGRALTLFEEVIDSPLWWWHNTSLRP